METNDCRQRAPLTEMLRDLYLFVIIMTFLLLCAGCSAPRQVVLQRTVHDTAYIQRLHTDSVFLRDSVYVTAFAKGDTVYRTREVTRWRDRVSVRRDTVFAVRDSSAGVLVPQECRATSWDKLLSHESLVCAAVWIFVATLIWLYHRKR